MPELLHECEYEVATADGRRYRPRVYGAPNGHVWIGWIEFDGGPGTAPLKTERETTQPDRDAVAYWATGLGATYFEGALARAR